MKFVVSFRVLSERSAGWQGIEITATEDKDSLAKRVAPHKLKLDGGGQGLVIDPDGYGPMFRTKLLTNSINDSTESQ